jgi:hypothetical protein
MREETFLTKLSARLVRTPQTRSASASFPIIIGKSAAIEFTHGMP